jgi:hypothetical protein
MKAWGFNISKNKVFEIQFEHWPEWAYIDVGIRWTRKCNHAGLTLSIELFGYYMHLTVYDNRHWNYEEKKWFKSHGYDPYFDPNPTGIDVDDIN